MLDGEHQIIKRAIGGEAPAFGLLYDHYQPQIYRFIYLKVSLREEAEDLTHQVFLKSWTKIGDYKNLGWPFSAWLYRIARNEVIDYYRTHRNYAELDAEDENADIKDSKINILERLDMNFDLERVKGAIAKLKAIEQDVIILRFIEDYSPDEIAKLIEKKPETARVIQHRAIKNLRHILAESSNS